MPRLNLRLKTSAHLLLIEAAARQTGQKRTEFARAAVLAAARDVVAPQFSPMPGEAGCVEGPVNHEGME